MAIERQYGRYELSCDVCGDTAEETFDDFQEAVDYKKANGWKATRQYGEWVDVCPKCQLSEFD